MMESNEPSKFRHDAPTEGDSASSGSGGINATLIAFLVVVAAAVVFFFQNSRETRIKFLFFDKDTAVRWSIIVSVVIGVILDRLISFWWKRRKNRS